MSIEGGLVALFDGRLRDHITVAESMRGSSVLKTAAQAAACIADSLSQEGKVVFFGNGGSAMEAGHLAAELVGRFYLERRPVAAISLSDATAVLTAVGNDYGYADVFSRQISALSRPGDVAFALSTSGSSPNVAQALETARKLGMRTLAMTGASGGTVSGLADICIKIPSEDTARIQELSLCIGHIICEYVERQSAQS